MAHKMIGIVGGIGSYAGIDLIRKVYDNTPVNCDQDHLPLSMISVPHRIVDRTKYLLGETANNPGEAIRDVINDLHGIGAEIIGIPCNTAHAQPIFTVIEQGLPKGITIVHLIHETAKYITTQFSGITQVGILSTTGTHKAMVYPDALSSFGLTAIQVSDEIQNLNVQPAIYDEEYGIKAKSSPVTELAQQHLHQAVSYLLGKGAEAIVLGCTEIPLAITENEIEGAPVIDATEILAKALIRESTKGDEVQV